MAALTESAEMARQRAAAIGRRRRLIWNNDGEEISFPQSGTRDGLLTARTAPLINTQVDCVSCGTGVTSLFFHLAEVGETFLDFPEERSANPNIRRNMALLREQGWDLLSATIAFCHDNGLEAFWAHRMNDVHDADPESGSPWLAQWKLDHPHCLLGSQDDQRTSRGMESPRWWWTTLDFEKPEVLDLLVDIQADVCSRYAIDGIECDYFRTPMFFRPNFDHKGATSGQLEIMSRFHRRLRELHIRSGEERGRPILTAARVPSTEELCRHVGIDVRAWLEERLVDLLIVSGGYLPFTEPMDLIRLAHDFGVQAYPCINTPVVTRIGGLEALRGAASVLWQAGADGLQLFNCFDKDYEPALVSDIGSPETLVGRDKLFLIDRGTWSKGAYVQAMVQAHGLPKQIPADGSKLAVTLPIGDDIPKAANIKATELLVRVAPVDSLENLELHLNGHALLAKTGNKPGEAAYCPAPEQYVLGANLLHLRFTKPAESAGRLVGVEASVQYD